MTGVERNGKSSSFARAYSMGRVSEDDAMKLGSHIADNSTCFTDAAIEYHRMIEGRNGTWHIAKLGEYDDVFHLNNVNNFHGMMQAAYSHYRGVASKYINRYAALFCVMRECRGMDRTEIVIHVLRKLRKISDCFFIRQRFLQQTYLSQLLISCQPWKMSFSPCARSACLSQPVKVY